jgi:hypothetical protein
LFVPALAQVGLKPSRVIYMEAGDENTALACLEEALRTWPRLRPMALAVVTKEWSVRMATGTSRSAEC